MHENGWIDQWGIGAADDHVLQFHAALVSALAQSKFSRRQVPLLATFAADERAVIEKVLSVPQKVDGVADALGALAAVMKDERLHCTHMAYLQELTVHEQSVLYAQDHEQALTAESMAFIFDNAQQMHACVKGLTKTDMVSVTRKVVCMQKGKQLSSLETAYIAQYAPLLSDEHYATLLQQDAYSLKWFFEHGRVHLFNEHYCHINPPAAHRLLMTDMDDMRVVSGVQCPLRAFVRLVMRMFAGDFDHITQMEVLKLYRCCVACATPDALVPTPITSFVTMLLENVPDRIKYVEDAEWPLWAPAVRRVGGCRPSRLVFGGASVKLDEFELSDEDYEPPAAYVPAAPVASAPVAAAPVAAAPVAAAPAPGADQRPLHHALPAAGRPQSIAFAPTPRDASARTLSSASTERSSTAATDSSTSSNASDEESVLDAAGALVHLTNDEMLDIDIDDISRELAEDNASQERVDEETVATGGPGNSPRRKRRRREACAQ